MKSLDDNPEQAKLHVMVMYSGTSCEHNALQVYSRTNGPVFWDPAGSFASHRRYTGRMGRRVTVLR
ncbi:hypothetical protein [Candidatus Scalindua japonica]|uniref:hypothetical protein n=1 Tax=Candidatus Scalindua japonica TaxID=1284222 RepID=UPI0010555601|nr:hypothetical protein [Candidatus Scalindua japonica]